MKTFNYLKIAVMLIGISILFGACGRSKKTTTEDSTLSNGAIYNPDGIELVYVEGAGGRARSARRVRHAE